MPEDGNKEAEDVPPFPTILVAAAESRNLVQDVKINLNQPPNSQ